MASLAFGHSCMTPCHMLGLTISQFQKLERRLPGALAVTVCVFEGSGGYFNMLHFSYVGRFLSSFHFYLTYIFLMSGRNKG